MPSCSPPGWLASPGVNTPEADPPAPEARVGEAGQGPDTVVQVVFSTTQEKAGWADTRIARGDLAEEVARVKREPGSDVIAHGGATFVQALSQHSPPWARGR
jgi:hypothetical protein